MPRFCRAADGSGLPAPGRPGDGARRRLAFLIEDLASGGAQRQLVLLARRLSSRGLAVEVLTYFPGDFFAPQLGAAGVVVRRLSHHGRLDRILAVRRMLRQSGYTSVLAFLSTPSLLAELAAIPTRNWRLVVSERWAAAGLPAWRRQVHFAMHAFADVVTANSHAQRRAVERHAPWLRGRVVTIYNAVDFEAFPLREPPRQGGVRLLGVGRIRREKNIPTLLAALQMARARAPQADLRLDWYGETYAGQPVEHQEGGYRHVLRLAGELGLSGVVTIHPPTPDVHSAYASATALVLPSLLEGLPNVVCEAMACGLPVLASDVCDNPRLVVHGRTGLLFDPTSASAIASALVEFCSMPGGRWAEMGVEAHRRARDLFDAERMADAYSDILLGRPGDAGAARGAPRTVEE